MLSLSIKPIQLDLHQDICVSFREDAFIASFGDSKRFHEDDRKGKERYIDWLKGKSSQDPYSVVHVWRADKIIGQIEMGKHRGDPSCGYINLYYLIPSERGQGLGKFLDDHAMAYFKSQQLLRARLSVAHHNDQAIAFYEKMQWRNLGQREDDPSAMLMEKSVT